MIKILNMKTMLVDMANSTEGIEDIKILYQLEKYTDDSRFQSIILWITSVYSEKTQWFLMVLDYFKLFHIFFFFNSNFPINVYYFILFWRKFLLKSSFWKNWFFALADHWNFLENKFNGNEDDNINDSNGSDPNSLKKSRSYI